MLAYYIKKPFVEFLADDASSIGNRILVDVKSYSNAFLTGVVQLISRSYVAVCLIGYLIYLNPWLGLSLVFFMALSYWVVSRWVSYLAYRYGSNRSFNENIKFKLIQDVLAGFKEIKLNQGEKVVLAEFERASNEESNSIAKGQFISILPRYILEMVGFTAVFGAFLGVHYLATDHMASMAVLAAYGMAGMRLLPLANTIFQSLAQIASSRPYFNSVVSEVDKFPQDYVASVSGIGSKISLNSRISLKDVNFIYPSRSSASVEKINIEIPKGHVIGLAGATGAGKSTIAEIACGLLPPSAGRVLVDNKNLSEINEASWLGQIGYVPQQVHVFSGSVFQNIACFGHLDSIDYGFVVETAKRVGLHDFIEKELPMGYETILGQGKTQLSGGQKQRLAFARAIYRRPQFLLFDEATSALDGILENQIVRCVRDMAVDRPVLLIGHRPASLKICHRIYFVDSGVVIAQGNFEELITQNEIFRQMMNLQMNAV
jgi:HlyD family secretion protein